jgi:hypothetical protein
LVHQPLEATPTEQLIELASQPPSPKGPAIGGKGPRPTTPEGDWGRKQRTDQVTGGAVAARCCQQQGEEARSRREKQPTPEVLSKKTNRTETARTKGHRFLNRVKAENAEGWDRTTAAAFSGPYSTTELPRLGDEATAKPVAATEVEPEEKEEGGGKPNQDRGPALEPEVPDGYPHGPEATKRGSIEPERRATAVGRAGASWKDSREENQEGATPAEHVDEPDDGAEPELAAKGGGEEEDGAPTYLPADRPKGAVEGADRGENREPDGSPGERRGKG